MTRKEPTVEEQIKAETARLVHSFGEWEHMRTKGCSDPFWPDGTNMNLVRNHIINGKRRLEELCGHPVACCILHPDTRGSRRRLHGAAWRALRAPHETWDGECASWYYHKDTCRD